MKQMENQEYSDDQEINAPANAQRRIADLERRLSEEKKKAEALRLDRDRYKELVENASEWMWENDANLRCVFSNRRVRDVLGYLPEEVLGKSSIEFMVPAQHLNHQSLVESLPLKSGKVLIREDQFIHKDGSVRYLETSLISVQDADGKITGYRGNCRDITRRKLAEQTLQKSEERFQLVSQAANDAVYDWDIASGTIWISESHRAILGFPEKEEHYRWWKSRLHPSDRERILASLRSVLKGGTSIWTDEYRFLCADGRYINVIDRGQILRDDQGRPVRIIGSMMDVTDRKLAEDAVRQSEENYRRLVEDIPIGIVVRSPDGRMLISNSRARRYAGITEEHDWNKKYQEGGLKYLREDGSVLPPEEYPSNLVIARNTGISNLIYGAVHPKSKEVHWFLTNAQPQRNAEGKLERIIVSLIDITARKKAEEALEESEAKYRFLTEAMSDMVWTLDGNMMFTYLSPSIESALGRTPQEIIGRGFGHFMTEDSMMAADAAVKKLLQREGRHYSGTAHTVAFVAAYCHRNGSLVWFDNILRSIRDEAGELIGIHGVSRNITEIRQAALEREQLIADLKKALADVKVLSGLLPICTQCKKIRDDKGYWTQIEGYISEHSDALFSHSICPECAAKLYPRRRKPKT